jgi:hypothetical protein
VRCACEVFEACAEVRVHTPHINYAHAWKCQAEILVHARSVECQEVPGRSEGQ